MDLHSPVVHVNRPFITAGMVDAALSTIETGEGIQASSRSRFKSAVFGRDSLEVGIDVLDHRPATVERILISIARRIGLETNPLSEEEPGKGLHEYRATVMAGQPITGEQLAKFNHLSRMWGGDDESMCYYGAIDTGALYLILLEGYCRRYGHDILDVEFVHFRTGKLMSIASTVEMSAEYYQRKIDESNIGLVEFQRTNPKGLRYQVMRDSADGMIHPDGRLANVNAPIAAIEVQTVAHAALRAAARLVDDNGLRNTWNEAAESLRQSTFDRLWMPDVAYFARAIDRAADGTVETIVTRDTAAGETLRDEFFDGLGEADRAKYIAPMVRRLFSSEFLVDIGFRTQSMAYSGVTDYWRYQGENSVWPTISKRIADGLYRQGLPELGMDVDARILLGCEIAQDFPEYFYVDNNGIPAYRLVEVDSEVDNHSEVDNPGVDTTGSADAITSGDATAGTGIATGTGTTAAAKVPMSVQAWTASAAFGALHRTPLSAKTAATTSRAQWQTSLVEEVIEQLWQPFTRPINRHVGIAREDLFYTSQGAEIPSTRTPLQKWK